MPFTRLVDRRLVVNPGSVGMPYGRPGGHYALLRDGAVTLARVEIDVAAAIAEIVANSAYPDRAAWADEYLNARASDADAIAAFGPRDGRLPRLNEALPGRPAPAGGSRRRMVAETIRSGAYGCRNHTPGAGRPSASPGAAASRVPCPGLPHGQP